MIRRLLSRLADNPLGDRLRCHVGYKPRMLMRPSRPDSVVSDLFPWRQGNGWQTRFEIMNLPSLIGPGAAPNDRITLLVFDGDGREMSRQALDLAPFETRRVDFSDFGLNPGQGTFACFHDAGNGAELTAAGSRLAERGYVGFRRDGDALWSYVHGNFNCLASPGPAGAPETLQGWGRDARAYRPQLPVDDSDHIELFLSNPTARPQTVDVAGRDTNGKPAFTTTARLQPKGCAIIDIPNPNRDIQAAECVGRPMMWRPVVFKHYGTHFDVLHG